MLELNDYKKEMKQSFILRIIISILFFVMIFCLLISRFWYLQVSSYEGFSERADRNRISVIPIAPRRGDIFDRNGEILARNYRTYTLVMSFVKANELEKVFEQLSPIITINSYNKRMIRRQLNEFGRYKPIVIHNNLNEFEASWFAVHAFKFPGLEIKSRWLREYPHGLLSAHVIGYIGRISDDDLDELNRQDKISNYRGTELIGKKGIEKTWEDVLHGHTGFKEVEVTSSGKPVRTLRSIDPIPGKDIFLSLDIGLQKVIDDAFGNRKGGVVAIDPNTGEILSLVSKPSFDPNLFINGIDLENWKLLNNSPDYPLMNRVLYGTYPIGSVYKPFVALAALELGKRTPDDRIFDPGYFECAGQKFRNPGSVSYGLVDLKKAIVVSSDTYFYSLSLDLNADELSSFVKQFGFGQITGIDLDGEKAGILPSTDWKRKKYSSNKKMQKWYLGDTISLMVGQGYNSFTLLQVCQGIATFANGGTYIKPHLAYKLRNPMSNKEEYIPYEPLYKIVLNESNCDIIKSAMVDVINHGTAKKSFLKTSYSVAGKTGTAQVFSLKGSKYRSDFIDEKLRDHALFIGFAPSENPTIAVAVFVENGGWGSKEAAPIARKIFDYWLLEKKK
ncbi:penicillin-binding protein 2 [Candidatus Kinetoplastibacterium desouzaii TCC079E]|uniref:Peptidoglycan D,D-transpeptidase MrdA n=1 Tax=Candidatus Kinetoplastidibacterium desouzai TCC079E TaxID=1208919 RepID=M1LND7_9PROT|nr:penicillin-binding protein 2 [Candidatus Kinetoplastibacterium desouzaii]AGF47212.1 penicillin-binding protein 2 [Candidatus Kinetoplastibacterium desouzaii TCC079E]